MDGIFRVLIYSSTFTKYTTGFHARVYFSIKEKVLEKINITNIKYCKNNEYRILQN